MSGFSRTGGNVLRTFLVSALLWACALTSQAVAQQPTSNVLFYTHPAREWNQALPLGNGRLGAMVFGNVNAERIQLNENTLWMGGPRDTNNPDALEHLAEVRRLLFAGLPVEAYAVAEKYSMGRPFRLESYQTLGDLRLTFEHEGAPTEYRLELDIDSAIARLTYRLGGVRYTREVFVSHPAQALVMRVSADTPGKITVSSWIDRQQDATTEVHGERSIEPRGGSRCWQRPPLSRLGQDRRRRRKARRISRAHPRSRRQRDHLHPGRGNELSRHRSSRRCRARARVGRRHSVRKAQGGTPRRSPEVLPPGGTDPRGPRRHGGTRL